jgi:hypothetical protein
MTFLQKRREILRNKPSLVVFVLVAAAAVLLGGYVLFLAVLAPEQLAEATAAATDLICDKCVGTTDIADGAVTSAKIGGSQVKNTDIAGNAVTSGKIADGQVTTLDIGPDAVTSDKIGKGQIGSNEIGDNSVISQYIVDGQVGTVDIANDAIKPNVHRVRGSLTTLAPGGSGNALIDCPAGEVVTGGGYSASNSGLQFYANFPWDVNTWLVGARNEANLGDLSFYPYALCIGPSP